MKKFVEVVALSALLMFSVFAAAAQKSLDDQLFDAIDAGNLGQVRALLQRGAHLEAKGNVDDSPLAAAANSRSLDIVQFLLDSGANIEARNEVGETPLFSAVSFGPGNFDIVKLLVDHGANIAARDMIGKTALFTACQTGYTDAIKLFLDRGADVNTRDSTGQTPLSSSVLNVESVRLLLDRGAHIEAQDTSGQTPLFSAVYDPRVEVVKLLLDRGANLEARDNWGETPLIHAIKGLSGGLSKPQEQAQTVELLLARGANVDANENDGKTALDLALAAHKDAIAALLQQGLPRLRQLDQTQWKDPQAQFSAYAAVLADYPQNEALRAKIIALAAVLPALPPVPEEARVLAVEASQRIKMAATPDALAVPITLLQKAIGLAPWYRDAYYNLAYALELGGQYDEAEKQMNNYLVLKPAEADAAKARARLIIIQTEKEAAAQK